MGRELSEGIRRSRHSFIWALDFYAQRFAGLVWNACKSVQEAATLTSAIILATQYMAAKFK